MSGRFCTSRIRRVRSALSSLILLASLVGGTTAQAADTVEPWARGARDVDFTVGYQGRRPGAVPPTLGSDLMIGYGVSDRLSAYVGTTVETNGSFGGRAGNVYAGIFGTVIETRHVDVDLFLSAETSGTSVHARTYAPAIEINLDRDGDRQSVGAYVRLALPYTRTSAPGADEITRAVEWNPGAYLTIARRHQVFLEWEASCERGASGTSEHGVALGYNVTLSPTIELVSQVRLALAGAGRRPGIGFTAGFIATMP
jgi:hypothetical protein